MRHPTAAEDGVAYCTRPPRGCYVAVSSPLRNPSCVSSFHCSPASLLPSPIPTVPPLGAGQPSSGHRIRRQCSKRRRYGKPLTGILRLLDGKNARPSEHPFSAALIETPRKVARAAEQSVLIVSDKAPELARKDRGCRECPNACLSLVPRDPWLRGLAGRVGSYRLICTYLFFDTALCTYQKRLLLAGSSKSERKTLLRQCMKSRA